MVLPMMVQLLGGATGSMVASTRNEVPWILEKENWNEPFGSIVGLASVGAAGVAAATLIMLLRLGMPLTKTVAKAQPGGRPVTGEEVKELAEQLLEARTTVRSLSMLRSCTIG